MKKILLLSTSFQGGGAEYVTKLMFNTFPRSKCVLFRKPLDSKISFDRLHVIWSVPTGEMLPKILVNSLRLICVQIYKLWTRPTYTISHLEGPNLLNLMTFGGGVRIIFVHNVVSQNYKNNTYVDRAKKAMINNLYSRADKIVSVSNEVSLDLVKNFRVTESNVSVLPNPINIQGICEMSRSVPEDLRKALSSTNYIISVASLTEQKNHRFMIDVFKKIKDKQASLKLLLVGDGPERGNILEHCRSLNLEVRIYSNPIDLQLADVILTGFQYNPYQFIRYARLFVLTSSWEGQPISVMEAMCLGVPIVASNCSSSLGKLLKCGGNSGKTLDSYERQQGECGYLIVNPDKLNRERVVSYWVESITTLLNRNKQYEDCVNACLKQVKQYDISEVSKEWESLLQT